MQVVNTLLWNDGKKLPEIHYQAKFYWLKLEGHEWPILAVRGRILLELDEEPDAFIAVDQDNGDYTGKVEREIKGWLEVPNG